MLRRGLLFVAVLLAIAGCGSVARATPSQSPSTSAAGQVTEADSNRTLTYRVGDEFEVTLHQQPGQTAWSSLQTSNRAVLTPVVDTRAAAAKGVTLAKFKAVGRGQADITANAGMDCSPGTACPALAILWKVTVVVA